MPYLAYARLLGLIIAALAVAFAVVTIKHWRADSQRLTAVQAERDQIAAQAASAMATIAAQQQAAYAASEQYQNELESLRNRPVPVRTVRLCVPTAAAPVPASGPAAGGPDADGKTAHVVPSGTGPIASRDIGADLAALALEGDRCSAQLRGLQQWVRTSR